MAFLFHSFQTIIIISGFHGFVSFPVTTDSINIV